jgi:hypothetical protein
MIPKIIHYCWFGGKPLPRSAKKCIASWRKFFPDYEIKEWNESNFDVNMIPYTAGAYVEKKYAFVSDYARFYVLYEYGGIYFDTDVEVIRPMDDILERGAYMGIEAKATPSQTWTVVAPGLGIASQAKHPIWEAIIKKYQSYDHFSQKVTVCTITTDTLREQGIPVEHQGFLSDTFSIYPADYFCPQAMIGAPIHLTENTRSIHHYDCSWLPLRTRIRLKLTATLPTPIKNSIHSIAKFFR